MAAALVIGTIMPACVSAALQETRAAAWRLCSAATLVSETAVRHQAPGAVRSAHVLGDGRLVVVLPGNLIALFTQNGGETWRLGAPKRDGTVGVVRDTVWHFDRENSSFVLYSLDGVKLGERVTQIVQADVAGAPLAPDAWVGGHRWIASSRPSAQSIAAGHVRARTFALVGGLGIRPESLTEIDVASSVLVLQHPAGSGVAVMSQPFADHPIQSVLPDGAGIRIIERSSGVSPFLRISDIGLSGKTIYSRTLDLPQAELADSTVTRAVDSLVRFVSTRRGWTTLRSDLIAEMISRSLHRPEMLPLVDRSIVGTDGAAWIRHHSTFRSRFEEWLVVSRSSDSLTSVRLPEREKLMAAGVGVFWTVQADSAQSVLRLRRLGSTYTCRA